MGRVYAAYDPQLDRKVALKLVNPEAAGADHATLRVRMLREAQAMARLVHPNVVAIHDAGESGGHIHIAMELVDGRSLRAWLAEEVRPWRDVLGVFVAAGAGLAAAHRAGLVHRDFKPDNVLIARDGRVLVGDFGMASLGVTQGNDAGDATALHLTQTGMLMGTPAYMAPEQLTTARVDSRADIYAFAVSAWEALFGEHPFQASDFAGLRALAATGRPKEPPRSPVPRRFQRFLAAAMVPDPEARTQTLEPLLTALAANPRRKLVQVLSWVGGALALLLVVFAGKAALEARARAGRAEARAATASQLGQEAKENELRLREQELLPLHDLGPAEADTRAGLAAMRALLDGSAADAPVHEALGRGLVALEDYKEARPELEAALAMGADSPDLHWVLGFTLMRMRDEALDEARRMAGPTWVASRKAALDAELLPAARQHLERARGTTIVAPEMVTALLAYGQGDLDGAVAAASIAAHRSPVNHDAWALVGHLLLARAMAAVDRGEPGGEELLVSAIGALEDAAQIRRSDPEIFDALARAWIRRIDLHCWDSLATRLPLYQAALLAAYREIGVTPRRARGFVRLAQTHFLGVLPDSPTPPALIADANDACVAAAHAAVERDPFNALALYSLGDCLVTRTRSQPDMHYDPMPDLEAASRALAQARVVAPGFPWAVNDFSQLELYLGGEHMLVGRPAEAAADADAAITAARTAARMDPAYVEPVENLVWAYALRASARAAIGLPDPDAAEGALAAMDAAGKLPGVSPVLVRANLLILLTAELEHAAAAGEDPAPATAALAHAIDRLIEVAPAGYQGSEIELMILEARGTIEAVHAEQGGALERAAIDRCVGLSPRRFECRALDIRAALAGNQLERARDRATVLADDFPRSGRGFALLAEAERRLGRFDAARAAAEQAIARAPDWSAAHATLGLVEAATAGDPRSATAALAELDRAVALNPLVARRVTAERAAMAAKAAASETR